MFLTALKVKLAAMIVVAGLNTDELPGLSPAMLSTLQKLADDQKAAAEGKGPDVNASFNTAVSQVKALADAGDKDANYALGHWGVLSNANVAEIVDWYRKASDKGHILAKAELAQVLLQAFRQDPERVKEAVKLIQDAEAADNKVARRLLAGLYLNGAPTADITQDTAKAIALLEKGSAAGDGEATWNLSQIYAGGAPGLTKDGKKSVDYLKTAAEKQNNAVAMSAYAARLFDGDPASTENPPQVQKNPTAAMEMFEKAASQGFAAANRLLGAIYENGLGGNARDTKKAVEYYTKAANGNDAQALFRLGNFFEAGVTEGKESLVQKNEKSALDLYRLAAQNGLAEAFYNVGVYYETGTVVDKDLAKAFTFHLRAANAGLPAAQHRLAGLYQNGGGVAQDLVAAIGWYQRAADAGYVQSQIALGQMQELGVGGKVEPSAAALNYSNAAERGAPLAMLRLASLYERGAATQSNKPELARAAAYAELAVDYSKKADIAVKYRDELQSKLTQEQKTQAKEIYESKKKTLPPIPEDAPASAAAPTGATPPATTAPASTPKAKGKK